MSRENTMSGERLRNHRLTGVGLPGPIEVVAWLGAVQAQDLPGALWALALRIDGDVTQQALLQAYDEGQILRTHILRPTWHFVAPADLRWMLALSAPRVHGANGHRYVQLGLDGRTRLRAERVIQRALEGGAHLTRHDLAIALRRARLAPDGQRLVHLLMHAELEGLICSGARRGKNSTYALVDERVSPASEVSRDEALARLVTRYFTSHGPATVHDCGWWSGLTIRDLREGVALAGDALEPRAINGREYWTGSDVSPTCPPDLSGLPTRAAASTATLPVHLLPNFDEFTVAYRDRTALLPASTPATSAMQMALLSQPVMVGGRSVGTWRRTIRESRASAALGSASTVHRRPPTGVVEVSVTLNVPVARGARQAVERAASAYARHVGRSVVLRVT